MKTFKQRSLKVMYKVLIAWHNKPSNFLKKEPDYIQEIRDLLKEANYKPYTT